MAIVPVPTSRVSDLLVRQRLTGQIQFDQQQLFKLHNQVSTGRRIALPSEDPSASARAISIQSLLERKGQVKTNLATNQSFLGFSDSTLSDVTRILAETRANALGVLGGGASDSERSNAVLAIDDVLQRLVNIANTQFRGRFLYAGSRTDTQPYVVEDGFVRYDGDERNIHSFSDIDLLFDTNIPGNRVFGAISSEVLGSIDFNPILTANTRLSDLRGGQGISKGSIAVSDGVNTATIDLGKAETLNDVVRLLQDNPPPGRVISVTVTSSGLTIDLDAAGGGNLTITEVGSGTAAAELGIRDELGVGVGPLVGSDVNPRITLTTPLDDIVGVRASAKIVSAGVNNDLIIEAKNRGPTLNGVTVSFVDTGLGPGNEVVTYNAGAGTLVFDIDAATTTAADIINILAADPTAGPLFQATLDPTDGAPNDGSALIDIAATNVTSGGAGIELDQTSGIQVTNGGQTKVISIAAAKNVEDLLNTFNGAGIGLLAEFNSTHSGVNLRTRMSGSDFSVGENGGTTASDLGLRSFTGTTRLEDMNYGRGVGSKVGVDFVIRRTDGVELDIDISGTSTINDVLGRINNHPLNVAAAVPLVARLASFGNGIELVNDGPPSGGGALTVELRNQSAAAADLGILTSSGPGAAVVTTGVASTATVAMAGLNNDLLFTSNGVGAAVNGVTISFVDTGLGAGNETVTYNAVAQTLIFDIDAPTTDANGVIALLAGDPIAGPFFTATLIPADGAPNDGTGLIDLAATGNMLGGAAETLAGTDKNPIEVDSIFTALRRLRDSLEVNEVPDIGRAVEILDVGVLRLTFARAELGSRQLGLETVQTQLVNEDIELQAALSNEIDVDLVETISQLTARQASFQAALQSAGHIFQLTLLDFI